jgi:hypothetical protein
MTIHPGKVPPVVMKCSLVIPPDLYRLKHEAHLLLGRINGSASLFFRAGIGGRCPLLGLAFLGPRGGCIVCKYYVCLLEIKVHRTQTLRAL